MRAHMLGTTPPSAGAGIVGPCSVGRDSNFKTSSPSSPVPAIAPSAAGAMPNTSSIACGGEDKKKGLRGYARSIVCTQ